MAVQMHVGWRSLTALNILIISVPNPDIYYVYGFVPNFLLPVL